MEIILTDNLSITEARKLTSLLQARQIQARFASHGPPTAMGGGMYFRVLIDDKNGPEASKILKIFIEQKEIDSKIEVMPTFCPNCDTSGDNIIVTKRGKWHSLFQGCDRKAQCNVCGHKWLYESQTLDKL